MEENFQVIISVACYHNDEEVIYFANQLSNQSLVLNIICIVTCNDTTNFYNLKRKLTKVNIKSIVFQAPYNLGYLNGCLYGIKEFGLIKKEDWIIISNTDILISNIFLLQSMIRCNKVYKNIWCIAPSVSLPTGEEQNPFLIKRPTRRKMMIWKVFQGTTVLIELYNFFSKIKKHIKKQNNNIRTGFVYAVHGSFFILNYQCVQKLLEIENKIFMYGEELLIAEIVRKNHGKILYLSEESIIHNENSTTKSANMKIKAKWYRQSFDYLYTTFYEE